MTFTTITSREFNQDTSSAKKAADKGPVVITDRGRPSHVLLRYEDYRKLLDAGPSLYETLSMPGGEDIAFNPPKLRGPIAQPVDFE